MHCFETHAYNFAQPVAWMSAYIQIYTIRAVSNSIVIYCEVDETHPNQM